MKYLITILFILITAGLSAQNKEDLVKQLGHYNLSPAGQDTIYKYAQSHYKELWQPSWDLMRPRTMAKTGIVFQEFFADKLSQEDLALIDEHWRKKQQEYNEETLANAPHFVAALSCQQQALDSLLEVYLPILKAFTPEIEAELTDQQKASLAKKHDQSIEDLRKKRDEFLNHAREFNSHVSTASEDYVAYGFAIMETIPSSYYYDLVSRHKGGIGFAGELALDSYFNVYGRFMDDVLFVLDERKCRGTPVIPSYHAHLRENKDFLRKDAILFAAIHFLDFENLPEIVQIPNLFVDEDSTVAIKFVHNKLDRLSQEEIKAKASLAGFMKFPSMGDDLEMYAFKSGGMPAVIFGTRYFDGQSKLKMESIANNLAPCLAGWRKIPKVSGVAYWCEGDGNPLGGQDGMVFFKILIPSHENSIEVEGMLMQPDEEMIYHILDVLGIK